MKFCTKFILIMSCSLLIVACGQTGPLYLPDNPPPGYPGAKKEKQSQETPPQTQSETSSEY